MKTIQLTDEQYNALMQGESVIIEPPKPKIEKWQPKANKYYICHNGSINHSLQPTLQPNKNMIDFGLYYPTKEAAKKPVTLCAPITYY